MTTGSWSNAVRDPFMSTVGILMYDSSTDTRNWNGLDDPIAKKRNNPYSMDYYKDENRAFTYRETDGREFTTTPSNTFYSNSLPSLAQWSSYDDNVLLDKLLGQINGHQFNLGVSLAESRQTFDLIKSTAQSIDKALRSLKKGNIPAAFRAFGLPVPKYNKTGYANDISDLWLQLQFGWLPLIQDVTEAGKALEHHIYPPIQQNFTAVRSLSDSASVTGNGDSTWVHSMHTSQRISVRLTESASTSSSLGLTDPASVVWEKVPYSFVVDWFIPIGTYLQNRSQIPALQTEYVSKTTKASTYWGCASIPKAITNVISYQKTFSFKREAMSTIPPPRFTSFKHTALSISARHAADAIALMVNNHGRK